MRGISVEGPGHISSPCGARRPYLNTAVEFRHSNINYINNLTIGCITAIFSCWWGAGTQSLYVAVKNGTAGWMWIGSVEVVRHWFGTKHLR